MKTKTENLIVDMWKSRVKPTYAKGYTFIWDFYTGHWQHPHLPYKGNIFKDKEAVGDYHAASLEAIDKFFEGAI